MASVLVQVRTPGLYNLRRLPANAGCSARGGTTMNRAMPGAILCLLAGLAATRTPVAAPVSAPQPAGGPAPAAEDAPLELGNFSVSLAVKDIAASRAFYEKLGFRVIGGEQAKNWLILQNKTSTIGLFQGPMFTKNMLTFNPGWDRDSNTLDAFDDVRDIQRVLKERGLTLDASAKEDSTGPASIMLTDPDGNPILIDQHVPRPRK